MNKIAKNEKGFSIVEGLVVIAVVVAISLVGYLVWHAHHKKSPAKATTKTTSTTAAVHPVSSQANQYLPVKEWGVRIPLPSDVNMADIYYTYYPQTGTDFAGQSYISIGSHQIDAIKTDCTVHDSNIPNQSPFGYIYRVTPTVYQQTNQSGQDIYGTLFDSYYYVWQPTEGECYQNDGSYDSQTTATLKKLTDNGTKSLDNFSGGGMDELLKNIQAVSKP
ncbi:MAG TPA: hypothetical protein VHB72_03730 [Candidatus Saccharimonadales bacterium]|nr:hypothetical protein [Candidatus Saccharimonadales bacterium]